jgi:hypothetical protein
MNFAMTSSMPAKISLFTPYYQAASPARQAELDLCLARNAACAAIDEIILMVDDGHTPPILHPKLRAVQTAGYPNYRQWLELAVLVITITGLLPRMTVIAHGARILAIKIWLSGCPVLKTAIFWFAL